MTVVLFIFFSALIFDIKQAGRYKEEIKNALDISTKAAAMQIDKNPEKIAQGVFEIDNDKAKEVFEEYLTDNLNAFKNDLFVHVVDYQAINTHSNYAYVSPATDNKYTLTRPTFIAVMRYTYKGIFIDRTITIDNVGGAQLNGAN